MEVLGMPLLARSRSLWVWAPLRHAGVRRGLYAAAAVGVLLLALASVPLKAQFDFINSDGRWYYVYLPSLVVDGDLDFSNQMRARWYIDWHPPLDQGITP